MKNRIPRRQELMVLIALSLACTIVVQLTGKYDVGLAVLGAPVFLVAALMGFRRGSGVTASAATEPVAVVTPEDDASMSG
jgi:hypothetical protein